MIAFGKTVRYLMLSTSAAGTGSLNALWGGMFFLKCPQY